MRYLALMLALFCNVGCATIINGMDQEISISSDPPGATVKIDGVARGKTPLIMELERDKAHTVEVELEGYTGNSTTMSRKVSGWVWGNILLGGIVGLVIDVGAGGMYVLYPDKVALTLEKKAPQPPLAFAE